MGVLSQQTIARVSGPAWEQLRGQFTQIGRLLLAVSPDADSDLRNTYVKFTVSNDLQSPVFAAIWFQNSKQLVVGLALPEEYEADGIGPPVARHFYMGLNKYFVVERGGIVPSGFSGWATLAYENSMSAVPMTGVQIAESEKRRRAG